MSRDQMWALEDLAEGKYLRLTLHGSDVSYERPTKQGVEGLVEQEMKQALRRWHISQVLNSV